MESDKKEIKYLKKIIKESVKEEHRDLKLSENCSNDAFRIEDYWDNLQQPIKHLRLIKYH